MRTGMESGLGAGVDVTVAILIGALGLAFGSFLNVCIARLPRHESIVKPRSRCPACLAPIAARDNVPVLSYLLLRARCRSCGEKISWRYPAVEVATAALWLLCWLCFGLTLQAIGMAVLCFLLLGLAAMDAETMLLPDAFTWTGIVLGILYSAAVGGAGAAARLRSAAEATGWAAAAAALMLAIAGLYWLVRRRRGLGYGDVNLLALIAAWLGPSRTLLAFFLAVVAAALFGLFEMRRVREWRGSIRIPLGLFLSLSAICAIFGGRATVNWYLQFFR
jgi:leader peptidase (prepilin peptidase)/N-methyltransferase